MQSLAFPLENCMPFAKIRRFDPFYPLLGTKRCLFVTLMIALDEKPAFRVSKLVEADGLNWSDSRNSHGGQQENYRNNTERNEI